VCMGDKKRQEGEGRGGTERLTCMSSCIGGNIVGLMKKEEGSM
jgi:hypothetical protein